jgi:hypothetical protein
MTYVANRSGRRDGVPRSVIVRDLLLFQLKLALDGLVDLVLAPLAIAAACAEVVFIRKRRGRLFYAVLGVGERADLWLNLYGASRAADSDGLFGGSRAGSETYLGELELRVRGGDRPRRRR